MEKKENWLEYLQTAIAFLQAPIAIVDSQLLSLSFNKAFKEKFKLSDGTVTLNISTLVNFNTDVSKIKTSKTFNVNHNFDKSSLINTCLLNIVRISKDVFIVEFCESKKDELKVFQSMMMELPGNIYWLSAENRFQGCNKQQAVAAGLKSPSEIIGKANEDMRWGEQAEELDNINEEVMRSKKTIKTIESAEMYDDEGILRNRIYKSNKMPILNLNNEAIGVLGVSVDITDLKEAQTKAEKALAFAAEAERRRKQFLSNQEHDINTALSGIIYAGMMFQVSDETQDLPELQESADVIVTSAKRLQAYNRSLLKDLSWLDNDGKLIERRANIRKTLTKLFDINRLAAKAKGSELIFNEIDDAIPQYLMVDDIALFQCLQDLIGNAISFTLNGTITLSAVLAKVYDKDNPVIAFYVKDTGRGIKLEHQRYIFEDYYKVLPSNQPDQVAGRQADEDKGRGLGLALSLKKAQAMGGELHLEWSEEGLGSEFVLTLPLNPALNQGR